MTPEDSKYTKHAAILKRQRLKKESDSFNHLVNVLLRNQYDRVNVARFAKRFWESLPIEEKDVFYFTRGKDTVKQMKNEDNIAKQFEVFIKQEHEREFEQFAREAEREREQERENEQLKQSINQYDDQYNDQYLLDQYNDQYLIDQYDDQYYI